ncbi:MAG: 1-deoxy-D-xylulose-5-phosphate reductoisomerase [Bryobacterales bacterium]|nr:1-deoxy-D-xylulose-5-phosphate reductoisomerase [Bryobacterales bacterium]
MKTLTILGSTGSIGRSTLDVVRKSRHLYDIFALVAGRNVEELAAQILEFRPRVAVVADGEALSRLREALRVSGLQRSKWPELAFGGKARVDAAVASGVTFVMAAIVGVAGLEATHAAVHAGKTIGLANKELLVASGGLLTAACARSGSELIPVDSEHNGAHQCLRAGRQDEVARLLLTASGGPFWKTPLEQLRQVTPEQALNHPTWKMGKRISLDSATMMNKGFEVIEACWLFGFSPSEVDVVIHPQSKVHAMVEYVDGSVLAQIATTDMRMPIQYALTYPDRTAAAVPRLSWDESRTWEFHPPDLGKFPLLRLAYEAQEAGGSAPCTLNAADEVAVEAFLSGKIGFLEIARIVAETLDRMESRTAGTVEEVLEIDRRSRQVARSIVDGEKGAVRATVAANPVAAG